MISEHDFVRKYTSFWRRLMPMGRQFAQFQRQSKERYLTPLASDIPARRRALVNELGFRIFSTRCRSTTAGAGDLPAQKVAGLADEIQREFSTLPQGDENAPTINDAELAEAGQIAERLATYLRQYEPGKPLVTFPEFHGCGLMEPSRGDVLAGDTLYEVKSGEREFRLEDLRQLIVYLALDYASDNRLVVNLGLVNPRMGIALFFEPNEVLMITSGLPAADICGEVVEYLSVQGNSR